MAITLGKDCSISCDGNVIGARSASISYQLRTVDVNAMDNTDTQTANVGLDCILNFETNDSADISGLISSMQNGGSTVSCSGGSGGMSFSGIVTNITENFSVDGVATFSVEARQGRPGL